MVFPFSQVSDDSDGIPASEAYRDFVAENIQYAENELAEAQRLLQEDAERLLAEANAEVNSVELAITGQLAEELAEIEARMARPIDQVTQSVVDGIGTAYGELFRVGFNPATNDEVINQRLFEGDWEQYAEDDFIRPILGEETQEIVSPAPPQVDFVTRGDDGNLFYPFQALAFDIVPAGQCVAIYNHRIGQWFQQNEYNSIPDGIPATIFIRSAAGAEWVQLWYSTARDAEWRIRLDQALQVQGVCNQGPDDPFIPPPPVFPPPRPFVPPPPVSPPPLVGPPPQEPPPDPFDYSQRFAGTAWDDPSICDEANRVAETFSTEPTQSNERQSGSGEPWGGVFDFAGSVIGSLLGGDSPVTTTAFTSLNNWVSDTNSAAEQALRDQGQTSSIAALSFGGMLAAGVWGQRVAGIPFDYLQTTTRYMMQYTSPQYLPSQAALDEMYLSMLISDERWECLTRALWNLPQTHRMSRDAKRSRLNVPETIDLYMREKLTVPQLGERLRTLGVTDPRDVNDWIELRKAIPPISDLIRFMVRDVADEAAVEFGGLDSGFDEKFSGRIREWAASQGVTNDVMKANWRAHWDYPSNTAIYEMIRRLRPDNTDPELRTTIDDARRVLAINDVAPGWIDRLLAVSYNPINRTDLLRFYVNGSIEKPELISRLQDTGYNLADAQRIVAAWELDVANRRSNNSRAWTRSKISKEYQDAGITRAEASELLGRTIPNEQIRNNILDDIDFIRLVELRKKCIAGIRKRVIVGEITALESVPELMNQGLDQAQASILSNGWDCEITSNRREPTVRLVSQWFTSGIVGIAEFYRRLRNLRYSVDDSSRIVAAALAKMGNAIDPALIPQIAAGLKASPVVRDQPAPKRQRQRRNAKPEAEEPKP